MSWLARRLSRRMVKKYGVDPAANPEFSRSGEGGDPADLDIEKVFEVFGEVKEKAGGDPDEMKRLMQLRFGAGAAATANAASETAPREVEDRGGASPAASGGGARAESSLFEQLESMRDQGMMSEEQFQAQRKMLDR